MSLENRLVPKGGEVDKLVCTYDLILLVGAHYIKLTNKNTFINRVDIQIKYWNWNNNNFRKITVNLDKSDKEIQEYLVKEIKIFLTEQLLET